MVGRTRTALKFFVYGLVAGLLFAPRSGQETRQQALDLAGQTFKNLLGSGGGESGGGESGQA
jgi:hypothetical protein